MRAMTAPALRATPAQRQRLRALWRSAGWPSRDMLELELIGAGWVERPLDIVETVGRAGVLAGFALPVIGVRSPTSPAGVAGLRTFDLVTMYAGAPIRRQVDLERALQTSRGATVPVGYLRPRRVEEALGGLIDLEVFDPGLAQLTPEPGTGEVLWRVRSADGSVDVTHGDPDRQFFLASATKLFVTAILAQLRDEGRLDWAAPLADYLSDVDLSGLFRTGATDRGGTVTVAPVLNRPDRSTSER